MISSAVSIASVRRFSLVDELIGQVWKKVLLCARHVNGEIDVQKHRNDLVYPRDSLSCCPTVVLGNRAIVPGVMTSDQISGGNDEIWKYANLAWGVKGAKTYIIKSSKRGRTDILDNINRINPLRISKPGNFGISVVL